MPLPPVGDVNSNVPLMPAALADPEYVNAPKLSAPVTAPVPPPVPSVLSVPDPVPTVFEANVNVTVLPDTVPVAVPVSLPSPRLARPMTQVAVTVLPSPISIFFRTPASAPSSAVLSGAYYSAGLAD